MPAKKKLENTKEQQLIQQNPTAKLHWSLQGVSEDYLSSIMSNNALTKTDQVKTISNVSCEALNREVLMGQRVGVSPGR